MTRRHPRNKQVIRRGVAAAILAAAVFPAASSAEVKDYYFPEVRIEAPSNRDGAFLIDEFRTFEFQGSSAMPMSIIPLRFGRLGVLRDVAVSDFAVTDEQGRASEDRGRGRRRPAHRQVVLFRPGRAPDIPHPLSRLRGHHQLSGRDRALLAGHRRRLGQAGPECPGDRGPSRARPFEGRSPRLGPRPLAGWAESRRRADGPLLRRPISPRISSSRSASSGRPGWSPGFLRTVSTLGAIKAEEEGYVRDTIARVRRAQADEAGRRQRAAEDKRNILKLLSGWGIWQIVGPLLWLFLYFRVWSAVGKDYRFEGLPDYVRELPADRSAGRSSSR